MVALLKKQFVENNFVTLNADIFPNDFRSPSFYTEWDLLVPDPYIKRKDGIRNRRYGEFNFSLGQLSPIASINFFQPESINSYAGGQYRIFEKLNNSTAGNDIIKKLIMFYFSNFFRGYINNGKSCRVGVHQIRVIASEYIGSSPTPEGLHSDGHDYVAIHLINRCDVHGGETIVTKKCGSRVFNRLLLEDTWDSLLIKDSELLHEVSPIYQSSINDTGYRDTLILDFNFY